MSMDFSRLLEMLLVTMPCAVVLSVCIDVGDCVCPISSSYWRDGMDSLQLMKSSPSSASSDEDITAFMILAIVKTVPFLGRKTVLFDMKNNSSCSASVFCFIEVRGVAVTP